nr:Breast cancer 2, early onset [Polyrhizophydium stewartii]
MIRSPEQVISTTATNAHAVCFDGSGVAEARQALLAAGARPNLATDAWVANHYSLIVWKLASLARRFPGVYATSWSFAGVVEQLKFRYEYEINGAHASAIKQIVQRDNTPSWHMVLCVSALLPDGMIEVTDGWYRIRAMLDDRLKFLVSRGSIAVGLKLRLHGAQLVGSEACAPLELTSSTYLKLHANGTQRAEWHAKLGFVPQQQHSPRSLKSLAQNGGNVVCVDVVVLSFADNVSKLANERHEPRNIRKHVRLLVCDYPPAGVAREHTRYALVTIWNEDDNYLLQFDEGKRFKFFQMSTNSREGSETLRLHTTHYSRHLSRPVDPARLASTRYTPRQLVLSDQLEGRRARDEVDMLGIVLVVSARDAGSATLAHRMHYQLLCTDAHQHLFVVEFKSSMRLGEMAPMAVLWFRNIEYVYFDSHFGAHKLRGSVFSQIKATGAMLPHGPGPRQELEAWAAANGALIEQMREAHASLLTDMASYSGRK